MGLKAEGEGEAVITPPPFLLAEGDGGIAAAAGDGDDSRSSLFRIGRLLLLLRWLLLLSR